MTNDADKITVSVVIPMHNSERFIKASVLSALSQMYTDEVICIDDCSSDNTVQAVEEIRKEDSRVKIYSLDINSGAAVARNKGVHLASSKYIAFLDADDLWNDNKLELQVNFLEGSNFEICCSDYYLVRDGNGKSLISTGQNSLTRKDLLKKNMVLCSSVVATSSLLKMYNFPLIRRRQDFALWLKITAAGQDISVIEEPLVFYQVRSDSLSSNYIRSVYYNWRVFRDYGELNLVNAVYSLAAQFMFSVRKRILK